MKKIILTGDRPTGRLHIGHLVGNLQNRVKLQDEYDSFFLLADLQVLTDRLNSYREIKENIFDVTCDYLGAGLKVDNTYLIQSQVPELMELFTLFTFLVSVARVERNPTIKSEASMYGVKKMSLGFLSYPVSQAADILAFNADLIPVGQDQLPHIEQTREIVRSFNSTFECALFKEPEYLLSNCPILIGTDGIHKMSKSLNNDIPLSASYEEILAKSISLITDATRIYRKDKGHPEKCFAFRYWGIFNPQKSIEIEDSCLNASIGCKECKTCLAIELENIIAPIRERRNYYVSRPNLVWQLLEHGTLKSRLIAKETVEKVKQCMKLSFFKR